MLQLSVPTSPKRSRDSLCRLPITHKFSQILTYGATSLLFGSSFDRLQLATNSPIRYSLPKLSRNRAIDHSCGSYVRQWPSSPHRRRHFRRSQAIFACEILQHSNFDVAEQHLHRQIWSFPAKQGHSCQHAR